jgi:hypothetical protein
LVLIIRQAREPDYAAGSLDLPVGRHTGERPIQRFVREAEIGGEFLESPRQRDGASVGAGIDGGKTSDATARGMNVAPFEPGAQRKAALES